MSTINWAVSQPRYSSTSPLLTRLWISATSIIPVALSPSTAMYRSAWGRSEEKVFSRLNPLGREVHDEHQNHSVFRERLTESGPTRRRFCRKRAVRSRQARRLSCAVEGPKCALLRRPKASPTNRPCSASGVPSLRGRPVSAFAPCRSGLQLPHQSSLEARQLLGVGAARKQETTRGFRGGQSPSLAARLELWGSGKQKLRPVPIWAIIAEGSPVRSNIDLILRLSP